MAIATAKTGKEPAVCSNQLFQELGITIRSFRARAALRRRCVRYLYWHYSGNRRKSNLARCRLHGSPLFLALSACFLSLLGVVVFCCFPNPALLFLPPYVTLLVASGSHASSPCSVFDAGLVFGSLAGLPYFVISLMLNSSYLFFCKLLDH